MKIKHIQTSSLIKTITAHDSIFKGYYTIDPYQNCSLGCIYCDSTYDDTVFIKHNALEILKKELPTIPPKRIIIGSVHDPYQDIEQTYHLTRSIISYLTKHNYPIHILTKSLLVLRDLDILVNNKQPCVTISCISPNEDIASVIEKNTVSVQKRFELLQKLQENHILSGIALIPILPMFIENDLETIIHMAYTNHSDYFLSKHLFLKGDQRRVFFDFLSKTYPTYLPTYHEFFDSSIYPPSSYQQSIDKKIKKICGRYHLPTVLPY